MTTRTKTKKPANKYLLSDTQVGLIISAMTRNSESACEEDIGASEEYKEVRDTLFIQQETYKLRLLCRTATRKTKSTK